MTELPSTLTYFGSLPGISQVLTRSAIPLVEAHQLNDAFLPTKLSSMPFEKSNLFDISVKFITHAILGKGAPKGQPNHPLQKAMMRWRMENRFNDESEIKETLEGLLPSMLDKTYTDAQNAHNAWVDYVTAKRLVPFYEKYQELALWETVGFFQKGAAIKFKCGTDSIFANCHPANYSKLPASTVNPQNYVEQMLGVVQQVEFDPLKILLTQNYTHRNFKEWRLIIDTQNSQIEFPASIIQSVYLGALVSESNAEKIKQHMAKNNPKVKIYHAKCKTIEYDLTFKKISENVGDGDHEED